MSEYLIFVFFLSIPLVNGVLLVLYFRSCPNRASWRHLVAGNLLVFCFLLEILFVTAEGYYRFFYDTTDSLNYTKVSQRWFKRHETSNAAGFRDNVEYALKIKAGKRRVTFVGDSFTVGQGVKNVDDRFANLIRSAHPEWEINLIAKSGFDTLEEIELLSRGLSAGYQLDQVVLVYCLNDVADILPDWDSAYRTIFADVKDAGWLRRNSYWVDIIYHHYRAAHNPYISNYFHFVKKGYSGSLWEKQKQRLTAMRDLVDAHGGQLLVVTFPLLHAVGPNYEFQSVHDELNRFWTQLKVPHLDLLPEYSGIAPGKITVNRHDAHPNEFAQAVAAKKIDAFLQATIR